MPLQTITTFVISSTPCFTSNQKIYMGMGYHAAFHTKVCLYHPERKKERKKPGRKYHHQRCFTSKKIHEKALKIQAFLIACINLPFSRCSDD